MQDRVGAQWEQVLQGKGYAPASDERFLQRFRASPYITTVLRYACLRPGSLILEPGCGSGKFSLVLASLGHQVIALDYVFDVLRSVQKTQEQLGECWPGRLGGLCQGSLERLPFSDDTFDVVVNEGVVEHWLDDAARLAVLREMVRVTQPGSVVAVVVPNGMHPLIRVWEARLEGFQTAPPMMCYSAERLGVELAEGGLCDIYTDGIYPWRSWTRVPPWDRLYSLGVVLDRWFPLPHSIREKWAINLIGIGRKAKTSGLE